MTNEIEEIKSMCATLHLATHYLWIREFQRESNPASAAKTFADELTERLTDFPYPQYSDSILAFFEQLVAELRDTPPDG